MYFSISSVKNDRAAQLALIVASKVGEQLLAGKSVPGESLDSLSAEHKALAVEAAVASVSRKGKKDVAFAAAQLLAQSSDAEYREVAIRVGLREVIASLGGEKNAQQFFRQMATPRASLRFQSVGGISDDIHAAKNRGALLAMRTAFAAKLMPNSDVHKKLEIEYVDFVKSIHNTLEVALDSKMFTVPMAHSVAKEIRAFAVADLEPQMKPYIVGLQKEAMSVVTADARKKIMAKFAAPSQEVDGPSIH